MKKLMLFALVAGGFSLAGCVKEPTAAPGEGGSGTIGLEFSSTSGVSVVETRATEPVPGLVAPAADKFDLRIVRNGANPATSPYWADITDYDITIKHQIGAYTATALCGDVEVEGFEKPAFGVEQSFEVLHNQHIQVPLVARLMNMAVTVDCKVYPDEEKSRFEQYFSDWSVEILRGEDKIAEFSETEARVLYIKPGEFKVRLNYTHQSNGKTGTYTFDVADNTAACTWHKVSLDVNEGKVGGAKIVITFDNETETVDLGDIEVGEGETEDGE